MLNGRHKRGEAMPTAFGTPQHWEQRAREAREMAKGISDPEAKRAMLEIADNYDKLAKRAEAKEAGVPMHPDGNLSRDA